MSDYNSDEEEAMATYHHDADDDYVGDSDDYGSDYDYIWNDAAYVAGYEAECAEYDYNYADTDASMIFHMGGAGLPDSAEL